MDHELAKQLKDAGFPYSETWTEWEDEFVRDGFSVPFLHELIEACGKQFFDLRRRTDCWEAVGIVDLLKPDEAGDNYTLPNEEGSAPEEAVAKLWLALNKKDE